MDNPEPSYPTVPTLAALLVVVARVIREDEQATPVDRLTCGIRERLNHQIESFCQSEIRRNPRIQQGLRDVWRRIQTEADTPTT